MSGFAEVARAHGFAEVGFCSLRPFDAQASQVQKEPEIRERIGLLYHPGEECPGATCLAVLLWPYAAQDMDGVFLDGYYHASNLAYHAASQLAEDWRKAGHVALANLPYPARSAAVRAGLGIIGDNGFLITPEYGSRVILMVMAVDEAFTRDTPRTGGCLHCGRCTAACPLQAVHEPWRCMRVHMMEGTVVPEPVRTAMGARLLGCDACQRCCPLEPPAVPVPAQLKLSDLFASPEAFRATAARLKNDLGANLIRPRRLMTQAAILAGNIGDDACLPLLADWAQSDYSPLRVHARWAIARITGKELEESPC